MRELQNATGTMQDSMNVMADGARKINETGNALSSISTDVQGAIGKIGDQIDRFKTA
jgi:methyl-accepting chemotaxis protein